MKNFLALLFLLLAPAAFVSAQDGFDYAQKEFELTFTANGRTQTTSCQAVRIHKNWFLTAAHCVSPCKKFACELRMWLALGPARAAAVLPRQSVFIPEGYEDEFTLPSGQKPPRVVLPAWDMALIRFNTDADRYEYYDAYGPVKEQDFRRALDAAFWEKSAEETSQQVARLYREAASLAEQGDSARAREATELAQELEKEVDELRAAAQAAPALKKQWDGAVSPRLAPLLAYTGKDEKFLLSNILVPRWTHGAFESRSSPRQVTYFGDNRAVWLSAGFGVAKGNSGGGVFLPVYNGGKKKASGLMGVVSAKSLNRLPEKIRARYALYGQELFLFVGFSEDTTLGFIRQVMGEYRNQPNVRPLTDFGKIKSVTAK